MKKIVFILNSLAGSLFCAGQQEGRMETDRPDQTESPYITKKKYFQAEFGFNYEKENGITTLAHPVVLWKYGAAKRFELRLITEFISTETPMLIPNGNDVIAGALPIRIGGKAALWEEKGCLPKTSLIFHIAPSKIANKKFQTDKWSPEFIFTMQHTLPGNIGLGYNLGAEWDGFSNTPYWFYTLSPGFNIGKKWYGFVEISGAIRKNEKPKSGIDGGIAYYFNDNMKLDLSGGTDIINSPDYIAIGFSSRFNICRKK